MKTLLKILALCTASLLSAQLSAATPVGPMNYQGRLLDNAGIPVTGNYNFVVRIYNDPAAGTLKYQESLSNVPVDDGVYSFRIGLGPKTGGDSSWDINLWQGNLNDLYLELVVNGETLAPRHELTSAPHAYTATFALSADALGNKTAAEFDNILEGVCVSGQGKWLDLLNKCLGVGATVTNETLATMMQTPDSNFKNLNLAGADLSGSVFGNVSFTGSTFKQTTLSPAGLEGADLGGVTMDDVTFTGAIQSASNINLSYATFKNLNMSKWNLSNAVLNGFSAANLTACPAALPASWVCIPQHNPSDGKYVLLGPGVNLSINSAAKVDTFGANTLDLHRTALNGVNLSGANLQGIVFQQDFQDTNLTGANLGYSTFDRVDISNANLTGANLSNSVIQWIRYTTGTIFSGTNFNNSKLYYINFSEPLNNVSFENATLQNVEFAEINEANFVRLLCVRCGFNGDLNGKVKFEDAGIYSGGNSSGTTFKGNLSNELHFINVDGADGLIFDQQVPATTVFSGGTLKLTGNFSGVTFDGSILAYDFNFAGPNNVAGPIFNNIVLVDLNFDMSNLANALFTGSCALQGNSMTNFNYGYYVGTNFGNCPISGASWQGASCPNGMPATAGMNPSSCEDGQLL